MKAVAMRHSVSVRLPLVVMAILIGLWLWIQWCRFPWSAWNEIRLIPAFMVAAGEPLYSPAGRGVIGTWMYGPVPAWLLWPSTWMPGIVSASLLAGAINILLPLGALIFACARWPHATPSRAQRLLAVGVAVALWPEAAWRFIQADNYAVGLGLLSGVFLLRASESSICAWSSALCAAAAVGCKQTALAIPLAQLVWIASTQDKRALREHALRLLAAGGAFTMLALCVFDPAGLWDTLIVVPGNLPFIDKPADRLRELLPLLPIHIALPAALFFALRNRPDPGFGRRLACLLWLCSLPLGLVAMLKLGGTINSFHGLQLCLPGLALAVIAETNRPRLPDWLIPGLAAAILILRVHSTGVILEPRVRHLEEGVALARANPGKLWFPWNPLVSYYAEGRFYHAEDGIYVRLVSGRAVSITQTREHLPADFSAVVERVGMDGWGVSETLLPRPQIDRMHRMWRIRTANPPPILNLDE